VRQIDQLPGIGGTSGVLTRLLASRENKGMISFDLSGAKIMRLLGFPCFNVLRVVINRLIPGENANNNHDAALHIFIGRVSSRRSITFARLVPVFVVC
jgi:hypothetical protein